MFRTKQDRHCMHSALHPSGSGSALHPCRWQLLEASAGVLNITDSNLTYVADPVGFTYSSALALGMNTVRAFGHGTVSAFPLQISPGRVLRAQYCSC